MINKLSIINFIVRLFEILILIYVFVVLIPSIMIMIISWCVVIYSLFYSVCLMKQALHHKETKNE